MPRSKGQGSTFTEEVATKIVNALRDGAYFKNAAQAAGVSHKTAEDWLYRGRTERDAPDELKRFAADVDAAYSIFEIEALANLKALAVVQPGGWRAILEVLARRNPEQWGETKRFEVAVQRLAKDEVAREVLKVVEDAINDPALDNHLAGPGARKAVLAAILGRLASPGGEGEPQ